MPASLLERLEQNILAAPADDTAWKIYADALTEAGQLPEAFAYALNGGAVPNLALIGYPKHHVAQGELQLKFNRFHFIEEATIRPVSLAGYELIALDVLTLPIARFLKRMSINVFAGDTDDPYMKTEAVRFAFRRAEVSLPAFTTLSLGHSLGPARSHLLPSLLEAVRLRAPALETTLETLVQNVNGLRLRVVSCASDLQVTDIVVGELLSASDHSFSRDGGPWTQTGDDIEAVRHVMTSSRPIASTCGVSWWNSLQLDVTTGVAFLNGTEVTAESSLRVLLPGDEIDVGPGLKLRVEAL